MRRAWWMIALFSMLAGCPRPPSGLDELPEPAPGSIFLDPRVHGVPVSLADAPPPISGGTLLVTGRVAVVADADRDRIQVVDLSSGRVVGETRNLPPGAEPTRSTVDGAGRAHTVLRGTGEIYSFDLEAVEAGMRRPVCPMPRGIAYDADADVLHVACRGGELVTLPAEGGEPTRTLQLERDLRDVVVIGGHLYVTRFRSAEVLEIAPDGSIASRRRPLSSFGTTFGTSFDESGAPAAVFEPAVAWRAVATPSGELAMVHQRASGQEVQPVPGGYGGGGFECNSSIVQSTVSTFHEDGTITGGADLSAATLPVDVAFSADGQWATVIAAGNESGHMSVLTYTLASLSIGGCAFPDQLPDLDVPNPVAAAYTSLGGRQQLVVQQRDPARLMVFDLPGPVNVGGPSEGMSLVRTIELGGEARFDTGHAVFHGNSGAFVACASCHPEGGDDGRTWTFGRIGARRTPAMHGDLRGTEPFHWDGDMRDLRHLVHDVFTGRMSGPVLAPGQVDALGNWLDELPAPVVAMPADTSAIDRGRTLFFGEAQCAACHSGPLFTNNATVDVGTGGRFQVPSLIGVSFRLPVMHSGCATTLRARFEPACGGGDAHGRTSHLSESQIQDLVAYLETL